MPQSLSRIIIHLTFSTKNRDRVLAYPDVRDQLNAYIVGILRNLECPSIQVGSVIDHVHILYLHSRTASLADVVGTVKRESSAWLKTQKPDIKDPYLMKFAWQAGYAAFSVSESNVEKVREYVATQEEHHRRITFQEEYRKFLEVHGVAFDERFMWD